MRRRVMTATLTVAALFLAALAASPGYAQQAQLPALTPPPPPPIRPYPVVAVTPPAPLTDPDFVNLRKQLADIAAKKDRAALAKLIWAHIFWIQDKDLADKQKSGVDNLAKAIDLDSKDGSGWDILTGFANEPTAAELAQQKGIFCAPADPNIDPKALDALGKATETDPSEWGYPSKEGLDVHAAADANSPVIEKLGMNLVHVLPDSTPPANANEAMLLHVATPSGKSGFIDAQALVPLGGDQMCYAKDASGWKIAGYFGGVAQQLP
jgi:hypothetical protein